jgi:aspartate-semialdehyde dehydrogenase
MPTHASLRALLAPALRRSAGMKQTFEGVEYTISELNKNRHAPRPHTRQTHVRAHAFALYFPHVRLSRLSRSSPLHPLRACSFAGVDIALFSAGGDISRDFAPFATAAGATVVDNSSAFRMTDGVPLVVPEVNPEAMKGMKAGKGGIIANPNCSTIIALMAVTPLHKAATVTRMVVSTYQAASGAGAAAMAVRRAGAADVAAHVCCLRTLRCSADGSECVRFFFCGAQELEQQTRESLAGQPITKKIFKQQARRPHCLISARIRARAAPLGYRVCRAKRSARLCLCLCVVHVPRSGEDDSLPLQTMSGLLSASPRRRG